VFLTARIVVAGVLVALLAPGGTSAPVPADRAKAEKELAAVAAKLHGAWMGGPCEGIITFREDHTYAWTGIGPGGDQHEGKWSLRGDPTQPTLVMECRKSFDVNLKENVELRIVRVGTEFEFKIADTEKPQLFERVPPPLPVIDPK
jgi:hypothetical protein